MRLLESLTVTQGRLSVPCVEAVNSEPILAVILLTLGICPGGVIFDDGHMTKMLVFDVGAHVVCFPFGTVLQVVPTAGHPDPRQRSRHGLKDAIRRTGLVECEDR